MKSIISIIIIFIAFNLYSQKEADNWLYGTKMGITFFSNDSFPRDISTKLWATDAAASISDRFGKLLFSTNGDIIFDRNNDTLGIINDTLLAYIKRGKSINNILTGSALILQKPCSENLYYVLHTVGDLKLGSKMVLYCTTVDMKGRNGMGEIWDSKKLINKDVIPYAITATNHFDNKSIWLVFLEKATGVIFFYKVSQKGIYYSHANGQFTNYFKKQSYIGNIKFSANGDKLAISTRQKQILVFDFDDYTGLISNPIMIKVNFNSYENDLKIRTKVTNATGLEFSNNSSKLYAYGRQWDLNLADEMAINSSVYRFYDSLSFFRDTGFVRFSIFYNYQLAPDGNIYIPWLDSLDAIFNPNEKDSLCLFKAWKHTGPVRIGPTYSEESEALPIFPTHLLKFQVNASFNTDICSKTNKSLTICENEPLQIYSSELKNASYEWSGPDGFYSNIQNPLIYNVNKNMTGWFVVKATRRYNEISIDSVYVKVKPSTGTAIVPNGKIKICKYTPFLLEAKPHCKGNKYLWSTGSEDSAIFVSKPGKYFLYVTDSLNCIKKDSITVSYNELKTEIEIIGNMLSCVGDSVILRTKDKFSQYHWSTGDTTSEIKLFKSTQCSVEVVDELGCAGVTEPVYIIFNSMPKTIIKGAISSCLGSINKYCIIKAIKDSVIWDVTGGELIQQINSDTVLVKWNSSGGGTIKVRQISKAGCPGYDTLNVLISDSYKPKILPSQPIVCPGSSIRLRLDAIYDFYEWSTGEYSPEIFVNQPGMYYVKVSDNNSCSGYDTVFVAPGVSPSPKISGNEVICEDEESILSINEKYSSYLWSTGDTTETITVFATGIYCAEVTDSNGCKASDCFEVKKKYINIEGLNDIDFGRINIDSLKTISLSLKNSGADSIKVESLKLKNNNFILTSSNNPPCLLAPNQSLNFSLKFKPELPTKYLDSIVAEISSPCPVKLGYLLSAIGFTKLSLRITDIFAETGDSVCISIFGKLVTNKKILINNKFSSTIEFDASSFYTNNIEYLIGKKALIHLEDNNLELTNLDKNIIQIYGLALLPEFETSDIKINSFYTDNIYFELETHNGSITVKGCVNDLSKIILNEPLEILITPNPVNEVINLILKSPVECDYRFIIYNSAGIEVKTKKMYLSNGINEININTNDLSNGVYWLKVATTGAIKISAPFVINK